MTKQSPQLWADPPNDGRAIKVILGKVKRDRLAFQYFLLHLCGRNSFQQSMQVARPRREDKVFVLYILKYIAESRFVIVSQVNRTCYNATLIDLLDIFFEFLLKILGS